MKYIIDEFGDLGYMLNGEVHYCLCPKMTLGKDDAMFCGLDCPFFELNGGFSGIPISVELSCASIKKEISITQVAKNVDDELTNRSAS